MTRIKIRAEAFASEWAKVYDAIVDLDGTVRVWCEVRRAYTRSHILCERAQARARRHARGCEAALDRLARKRAARLTT